jgi:hypothetical protein
MPPFPFDLEQGERVLDQELPRAKDPVVDAHKVLLVEGNDVEGAVRRLVGEVVVF